MAQEEPQRCPYCHSTNFKQVTSNYAARTVSRTLGWATGITMAAAGNVFTFGKAADKVMNFCATNVVEPITEIVEKQYKCNRCGKEFTRAEGLK